MPNIGLFLNVGIWAKEVKASIAAVAVMAIFKKQNFTNANKAKILYCKSANSSYSVDTRFGF
jgi:hypothetical protein